ncbi:MAG TPA: hypothetical protein VFU11_06670 [Solirubrobacterales bacterium]|nr:hypothetical protein [Solirubrobacterales bacterium]
MRGRAAIVVVVIALATSGAAATATSPIVIGEVLRVDVGFGISPSALPKRKPRSVRLALSARVRTDDGSHVPALTEMELKLDRHFFFDLHGVPVCRGGGRDVRSEVLEGCEDAIVGRGTVEVEVAFPEEPLMAVSGSLRIYNRGHKPGGANLAARAYFPAPVTGAVLVPVEVRKMPGGRYGWRARLAIPKIAGGYGSITAFSARIDKRIVSATCGDGKLQIGSVSTFADGMQHFMTAIHLCSVARPAS